MSVILVTRLGRSTSRSLWVLAEEKRGVCFCVGSRFPHSVSLVPDGDTVLAVLLLTVPMVVEHMLRKRATNVVDFSSAHKYFR